MIVVVVVNIDCEIGFSRLGRSIPTRVLLSLFQTSLSLPETARWRRADWPVE